MIMRGDLDRRATRDEATTRALGLMDLRGRPVLVGEVALAIGSLWSLEDAETLLEQLATTGAVRRAADSPITYEKCKVAV